MPEIKKVHAPEYEPIADLVTYRVLPTRTIAYLDPFLFLNHHGPQVYKPGNRGLPFGPHPHRGMETVTIILDGDIAHRDSGGHESVITAGGVQWMTAGRGLIHEEVSSASFMQNGGALEILQLWINLPAALKMTEPYYKGLQAGEIPAEQSDDGKVRIQKIAGKEGEAAFTNHTKVHLDVVHMAPGAQTSLAVPEGHSVFFYIIRGSMRVNDKEVEKMKLVEFDASGGTIGLTAHEASTLLFGHAKPLNEPVVSGGPFVMNTEEEIAKAYDDFRNGKFGEWPH
jgi:redox-sensitive bicupin YhaK (pirin superfamily)